MLANIAPDFIQFFVETISENLLKLRKTNNMTQQQVSAKLNISTGTYCDYENGKNLIKTNALYGLTTIYKPFSLDIGDWYWIGNWVKDGVSTYDSLARHRFFHGDMRYACSSKVFND